MPEPNKRRNRGVRENIEPGIYRSHRTSCRSGSTAASGRRTRCDCPYSVMVPTGKRGGAWASAASLDEARRVRARAVVCPAPIIASTSSDVTLADFTVEFMRARASGMAPATIGIYERAIVGIIAPALGHHRLSEMTRARLEVWVAELEAHPHRRTAEQALECLKAMLTVGMTWDRPVPGNAVLRLRMRRPQQVADDETGEPHKVLTDSQIDALLAAAELPQHRVMVLLALDALLRRGEIIGLRWSAVQLERRRLLVGQNIWQGKVAGEKVRVVRRPKSGRPRSVAITDRLAEALAALYAVQVIGRGDPADGLVLPGRVSRDATEQRPQAPDSPTTTIERLLQKAGLVVATVDEAGVAIPRSKQRPLVSLHGLRHTGASLALARGVPLITVSKQLGHGRIKTTSDAYAHIVEDAQLDAFTAGLDDAGLRAGLRQPDDDD